MKEDARSLIINIVFYHHIEKRISILVVVLLVFYFPRFADPALQLRCNYLLEKSVATVIPGALLLAGIKFYYSINILVFVIPFFILSFCIKLEKS